MGRRADRFAFAPLRRRYLAAHAALRGIIGKVVPLKVSGAFHIRFVADAAAEFRQFCARFTFKPGRLPVVSNLSARPHDGRDWPDRLAEHLTLAHLRQQGPMLF